MDSKESHRIGSTYVHILNYIVFTYVRHILYCSSQNTISHILCTACTYRTGRKRKKGIEKYHNQTKIQSLRNYYVQFWTKKNTSKR